MIKRPPRTSLVSMETAASPAQDGGYDELAALMVRDKGLSTFRSYMKLNTQNLLILQAEITLTEKELRKVMQEDQGSGEFHREKYRACVSYMKEGIESSAQWAKWLELRELLEKYNTAMAQHSQLLQYRKPHKNDLQLLKQWLANYTQFYGTAEYDQWFGTEEHERDLITLSARYQNVDPLTRWVFGVCIPFWHEHVSMRYYKIFKSARPKVDIETGTVSYRDESIIRATRITSTLISSAIPASSIIVLYFVHNMATRLAIIIIYNILFSIFIGLLARARRVEVFAASTAFAAVQVAFITNFPQT